MKIEKTVRICIGKKRNHNENIIHICKFGDSVVSRDSPLRCLKVYAAMIYQPWLYLVVYFFN